MDLESIANVAEIVGVILVVVTLVFLTLQIRQNTRALKSTTIQAALQSEMVFASLILADAATWNKVLQGDPLEAGAELRKGIILINVYMTDSENRFHQFHAGHLDEQAWEGRLGTLPNVVRLPVYEHWRKSMGGQSHTTDFLDLIDNLKKESLDD